MFVISNGRGPAATAAPGSDHNEGTGSQSDWQIRNVEMHYFDDFAGLQIAGHLSAALSELDKRPSRADRSLVSGTPGFFSQKQECSRSVVTQYQADVSFPVDSERARSLWIYNLGAGFNVAVVARFPRSGRW